MLAKLFKEILLKISAQGREAGMLNPTRESGVWDLRKLSSPKEAKQTASMCCL